MKESPPTGGKAGGNQFSAAKRSWSTTLGPFFGSDRAGCHSDVDRKPALGRDRGDDFESHAQQRSFGVRIFAFLVLPTSSSSPVRRCQVFGGIKPDGGYGSLSRQRRPPLVLGTGTIGDTNIIASPRLMVIDKAHHISDRKSGWLHQFDGDRTTQPQKRSIP